MSTEERAASPGLAEELRGWFAGRVPDEWFTGPPEIQVDREEITVIGHLPGTAAEPDGAAGDGGGAAPAGGGGATEGKTSGKTAGEAAGEAGAAGRSDAEASAAALGRARRFREDTRDARIEIAREVERMFGRKVSWGVLCEGRKVMFTTLSAPVMTRLRQSERRVLDTLVDAGVARSRSDALAWCVRLVGEHEESWLGELREALRQVEQVRAGGPQAS
ncbi:MAG: hypothetical protein LBI49_22590 [Nocardiopsaceae bacterium]|jgi:hypothetical protein|nr:hypothetical protein [Nocardiopsaceae bacterium]